MEHALDEVTPELEVLDDDEDAGFDLSRRISWRLCLTTPLLSCSLQDDHLRKNYKVMRLIKRFDDLDELLMVTIST